MFQHILFIAEQDLSMADYFVTKVMPLLVILIFAYYPASLITGLLERLLTPSAIPQEGPNLGDEIGPTWTWCDLFSLWGVFVSVFYFYWDTGAW